ncbi:MAG: hypothetical protein HDR37_02325, partial [Treponema sp.]|nr:hypothetical protein [Treponema sp.]
GKEISGKSDYTLFTDDNKAKLSTNTSIISLSADALAQMTNQLTIYNIRNMIISGNAKTNTVNWQLTNIVFEGDMSNLKNDFTNPVDNLPLFLYGIVYFKDKPYYNNLGSGQSVEGMVKLDNLQGVSSNNFKVGISATSYSVLDVSGVGADFLDRYNPTGEEIISKNGRTHAIYFPKDYAYLKNIQDEKERQEKINELCYKFVAENKTGIINVYLGDDRDHGNEYSHYYNEYLTAASKTPRTLKEFEYFGNYYKFEKSAYSSYSSDEFNNLPKEEKEQLEGDKDTKQIAQNNRKCFSCVAKSFV